jgi:hypothetical protein
MLIISSKLDVGVGCGEIPVGVAVGSGLFTISVTLGGAVRRWLGVGD